MYGNATFDYPYNNHLSFKAQEIEAQRHKFPWVTQLVLKPETRAQVHLTLKPMSTIVSEVTRLAFNIMLRIGPELHYKLKMAR